MRRKHADVLVARGEREEAVDELLRLGDVEAAGRLCLGRAAGLLSLAWTSPQQPDGLMRWESVLTPTPEIASVILRVAFALEQCGRGVELIDRHGFTWLPEPDTPDFEEALSWRAGAFGMRVGSTKRAQSPVSFLQAGTGRSRIP